jgi:Domain of unknown function (DUF4395)
MSPHIVPAVGEPNAVDARADRGVQAAIAVLILGGFVFRQPWVVPLVLLPEALGALGGPARDPLYLLAGRIVASRLPPGEEAQDAATIRGQCLVAVVLLGTASVAFLFSIDALGWTFALVEAGIAVIAATTRVHAGAALIARLRRR